MDKFTDGTQILLYGLLYTVIYKFKKVHASSFHTLLSHFTAPTEITPPIPPCHGYHLFGVGIGWVRVNALPSYLDNLLASKNNMRDIIVTLGFMYGSVWVAALSVKALMLHYHWSYIPIQYIFMVALTCGAVVAGLSMREA